MTTTEAVSVDGDRPVGIYAGAVTAAPPRSATGPATT